MFSYSETDEEIDQLYKDALSEFKSKNYRMAKKLLENCLNLSHKSTDSIKKIRILIQLSKIENKLFDFHFGLTYLNMAKDTFEEHVLPFTEKGGTLKIRITLMFYLITANLIQSNFEASQGFFQEMIKFFSNESNTDNKVNMFNILVKLMMKSNALKYSQTTLKYFTELKSKLNQMNTYNVLISLSRIYSNLFTNSAFLNWVDSLNTLSLQFLIPDYHIEPILYLFKDSLNEDNSFDYEKLKQKIDQEVLNLVPIDHNFIPDIKNDNDQIIKHFQKRLNLMKNIWNSLLNLVKVPEPKTSILINKKDKNNLRNLLPDIQQSKRSNSKRMTFVYSSPHESIVPKKSLNFQSQTKLVEVIPIEPKLLVSKDKFIISNDLLKSTENHKFQIKFSKTPNLQIGLSPATLTPNNRSPLNSNPSSPKRELHTVKTEKKTFRSEKILISEKPDESNFARKRVSFMTNNAQSINMSLGGNKKPKLIKELYNEKENISMIIEKKFPDYKLLENLMKTNSKVNNFSFKIDNLISNHANSAFFNKKSKCNFNNCFYFNESFMQIQNFYAFMIFHGNGENGNKVCELLKNNFHSNLFLLEILPFLNFQRSETKKSSFARNRFSFVNPSPVVLTKSFSIQKPINQEFLNHLIENESSKFSFLNNDLGLINSNLRDAFQKTHEDLLEMKHNFNESGATLCSLYIIGTKLFCVNLGDSRAITGRYEHFNWKSSSLSKDHKPNMEQERERIEKYKGKIKETSSKNIQGLGSFKIVVNNQELSSSRYFGNFNANEFGVIHSPDIYEYELRINDKILIIASNLVWEYFTNLSLIELCVPYFSKGDPQGAANEIIKQVKSKHVTTDSIRELNEDILVTVIFLDSHI